MRVKNWTRFQHYKHRNPPWLRLYRDLLNDREWFELDPVAAKALINLWLIACERDGELPPVKDLAFRLRMTEKQVNSIISQLSHWLVQDASSVLASRTQDATPETETETETDSSDAVQAPPKRGSQVPENWRPSTEAITRFKAQGFQQSVIDAELEKFSDYHKARGSVFKDHEAAFRTWMRNAKEFAGRNGNGRGPRQEKPYVPRGPVKTWAEIKASKEGA